MPEQGEPLFISPQPDLPPEVSISARDIRVTFADRLDSARTYTIGLNSAITDLRNNALDGTVTLSFSTGASLDSGLIAGTVFDGSTPRAGVLVGLWPIEPGHGTDSIGRPDYLVSSNQDGAFSVPFLPAQPFWLVAFADDNRNQRPEPDEEPFAVADRPLDLSALTEVRDLRLTLSTGGEEDSLPEVRRIALTTDGLVRLSLSRPFMPSRLPQGVTTLAVSDSIDQRSGRALLEPTDQLTLTLTIWFGELSSGTYTVRLADDSIGTLSVDDRVDRLTPEIVLREPDPPIVLADDLNLRLRFSEPLIRDSISPESWLLLEDSVQPIPLSFTWDDPLTIRLQPERVSPGGRYELEYNELDLFDLAGNTLGDSIGSYAFTVLDPDSLGSISGSIAITIPERERDLVSVTALRVEDSTSFTVTAGVRDYLIAVPAGAYLVSAYIDSDGDGIRSLGSVRPYQLAETALSLTDTVFVRARFETAGIDLVFQ